MNRELLKQCLAALEWYVSEDDVIEGMEGNEPWVEGKRNAEAAIEALKEEIAKPEPEPAAWMNWINDKSLPTFHRTRAAARFWGGSPVPLYAAPTEPKWGQVSEYHAALQRVEPRRTYAKTEEDTASW